MQDLAVEQIGDRGEPDVRMRAHVDALAGQELGRPHLVEEDERADHLPRRDGSARRTSKPPRSRARGHDHGLERRIRCVAHRGFSTISANAAGITSGERYQRARPQRFADRAFERGAIPAAEIGGGRGRCFRETPSASLPGRPIAARRHTATGTRRARDRNTRPRVPAARRQSRQARDRHRSRRPGNPFRRRPARTRRTRPRGCTPRGSPRPAMPECRRGEAERDARKNGSRQGRSCPRTDAPG